MKFSSHLFLRWFTWQNNKKQRSIYYSQHCQPSFAKAINLSLKTLPPFPKQYRRSASNRWESCPAAQRFPPRAAWAGWGSQEFLQLGKAQHVDWAEPGTPDIPICLPPKPSPGPGKGWVRPRPLAKPARAAPAHAAPWAELRAPARQEVRDQSKPDTGLEWEAALLHLQTPGLFYKDITQVIEQLSTSNFSTSTKGCFLTSPHCYLFWKIFNENTIYFFPKMK